MALLMAKDNGIYATWDGGGDEIDITSKVIIEAVYACTITGWTIIGSPSGSAVVTVKKCTYANYPSGLTAISGTEKPTLSSTDKNQDLTLTTWTVAVAKGDILEFSIDSLSTITKLIVSIRVTKT
jgi:hypothetical protein